MTKKTCPLGEDCDLTLAWMMGAEDARDKAKARIEALTEQLEAARLDAEEAEAYAEELEAKLAKAVEAAYREGFLCGTEDGWVNNPRIDIGWKCSRARATLAELKGDKP